MNYFGKSIEVAKTLPILLNDKSTMILNYVSRNQGKLTKAQVWRFSEMSENRFKKTFKFMKDFGFLREEEEKVFIDSERVKLFVGFLDSCVSDDIFKSHNDKNKMP